MSGHLDADPGASAVPVRMAPALSGRRPMFGDNASRKNSTNPKGHVGR